MLKKKVINILKKFKQKIPQRLRWKLSFYYVLAIIVGLILSLASIKYLSLSTCAKMYGQEFCTPTGIFLILIMSIPGYFIVGNLLPFLINSSWLVTLVFVILSSFLFYFLTGLIIEKYLKLSPEGKTKFLIYTAFIILLILLVLLLL